MVPAIQTIRHRPVVSCEEASQARGVALKTELKTLILQAKWTIVAVHLRADHRLQLRRIKKLLRVKNVSFMSPAQLQEHGLAAGLINPWNIAFCSLHVVCLHTFANDIMTTNNSRLDEGVFFKTEDLFMLPNLIVGFFGHEQ
jgi:hypothetical protein